MEQRPRSFRPVESCFDLWRGIIPSFYYRKLTGNIPDSKTLKQLLSDIESLGLKKLKLVMDRGFYSAANINALFMERIKFLIGTKMSLRYVREHLEPIYDTFRNFDHYSEDYELYHHTTRSEWSFTHERPYKGDVVEEKRRYYLHYYFNIDRAAEEEKAFDKELLKLRKELETNRRDKKNEAKYKKYFETVTTPMRGTKATVKAEAVAKTKRYFGFFALMSNEKMDAITALEIYRNKDLAEKAFDDLKNRLNFKRTHVSSELSLDGKIFIEFVALIYLSYVKKAMQSIHLFSKYTIAQLLD